MVSNTECSISVVQVVFKLLDKDKDQHLNWNEFVHGIGSSVSAEFPAQDMQALAFDIIDTDVSNTISQGELEAVMTIPDPVSPVLCAFSVFAIITCGCVVFFKGCKRADCQLRCER